MEKREPCLVPEWLTSTGHGYGGGSKNHILSSSARSDSSLSHNSKSWNSRTKSDVDSVRSPFLDRSSSTNTRRGLSNGSTKNAYSSFNVQKWHKYTDQSKEKDRLSFIDHDTSFPFDTFLRQSNSMKTRKQGDQLAQGFTAGLKKGRSINIYNRNGILPGKSAHKLGFDKNFPFLRTKERNGGPDVVRISSPAGEGWTSALAEVPNVIDKSGSGSVGNSVTLTGQTCRNMAEALVQGSSKIQILEDRSLKQSRQLIPVVPSAPKGTVLNSFDKSKTKPIKKPYQQSSVLLGNLHTNHGSQIKPDTTKKLVVLKPARENGVYSVKESGSPSRITNSRAAIDQMATATNNPRELRGASVNMLVEKKLSLAPTQSRSAFYRALKKKTSTNISTDPSKTSSCNANISKELVAIDRSSVDAAERDEIIMERAEKVYEVAQRNNGFESADPPDEKEAEFLISLGWDENNTEEDEALTEEEIRAFIEQCKKLKPSLVQKLPII